MITNKTKYVNGEIVNYIEADGTILVSLDTLNKIFYLNEDDLSTIKSTYNKKHFDYNDILHLSKKYKLKNNRIISSLQMIKPNHTKFFEFEEKFAKPVNDICYAIENKLCLKLEYKNYNERFVEPLSIGKLKNGQIALYVRQIAGYSNSVISSNAFRMFYLNKIYNVEILEKEHFEFSWIENLSYKPKRFVQVIKQIL